MTILTQILLTFVAVVGGVVVLSYAFSWYENANRRPELLERRFTPQNLWLALRLVILETFFLIVTILAHPFGWFGGNRRTPRENHTGTPIIFLHGLFHNRACWWWLCYRLRRRGLAGLHTLNLPPWKDVEALTERVAKKVDELRHRKGVEKVHLVGHSMGGIIARNYIQIRGGAEKVDQCIMLASPHTGSKLAPFALTPLGGLLMPGSPFLQRLNEAEIPPGVRLFSIYSRHDNIIQPWENARMSGGGVRNVELKNRGHVALLYHSRVLEALTEKFTEASS